MVLRRTPEIRKRVLNAEGLLCLASTGFSYYHGQGRTAGRQPHGREFRYAAATTLRQMRGEPRLTAGAGRKDVSAAFGVPHARLGKGNGTRDSNEISQRPSELVGK
jgi:hypothetical protein